MALSNWDTLTLNEKGEPIRGTFISPQGVLVDFYKNWLYVADKKAWRKGGHFNSPIIMQIEEGNIKYVDVTIMAIRGPQNGVYAIAYSGYESSNTIKGIIGCGVYGYLRMEWIGVKKTSIEWFQKQLRSKEYEFEIPEIFKKINFDNGLRFNQGDSFFANNNVGNLNMTKTGDANPPLIEKMIRKR